MSIERVGSLRREDEVQTCRERDVDRSARVHLQCLEVIGLLSYPQSSLEVMSGRTGQRLYEFHPDDHDGGVIAAAAAGDHDHDGRGDILVGVPQHSESGMFLGKVTVHAGNDLFLLATPRVVGAGDLLRLDTREGQLGDPNLMAVVEVNGAPFFDPVFGLATFDATGGTEC